MKKISLKTMEKGKVLSRGELKNVVGGRSSALSPSDFEYLNCIAGCANTNDDPFWRNYCFNLCASTPH